MSKLGNRPELLPVKKTYSIVKIDTWKPPTDDDFAIKVGEIDSLEQGPITKAGRGESIVVLDEDGNSVSVTDGPDHPKETTVQDEIK